MKTPKPTGTSVCPPDVKHAYHIDGFINERAETCDLGDSNFDDAEGGKTDASLMDDKVEWHVALVSYPQTRVKCNSGSPLSRPPTLEHFRPGSS